MYHDHIDKSGSEGGLVLQVALNVHVGILLDHNLKKEQEHYVVIVHFLSLLVTLRPADIRVKKSLRVSLSARWWNPV
jgi:hypothetical protein